MNRSTLQTEIPQLKLARGSCTQVILLTLLMLAACIPSLAFDPLYMVHIPKSGSSFVNALLQVACNDANDLFWVGDRPPTHPKSRLHNPGEIEYSPGWVTSRDIESRLINKTLDCPLFRDYRRFPGVGTGAHTMYEAKDMRRVVILYRDVPAQRYSFWKHLFAAKGYGKDRRFKPIGKPDVFCDKYKDLYLKYTLGNENLVTSPIDTALSRIHDEFLFVGLTEYYKLSVCTLHCIIAPRVHVNPLEFMNMHKTPDFSYIPPQVSRWRGDCGASHASENRIYLAAVKRFKHDVRTHYNCITQEVCRGSPGVDEQIERLG